MVDKNIQKQKDDLARKEKELMDETRGAVGEIEKEKARMEQEKADIARTRKEMAERSRKSGGGGGFFG